jgi:hypothetical protein
VHTLVCPETVDVHDGGMSDPDPRASLFAIFAICIFAIVGRICELHDSSRAKPSTVVEPPTVVKQADQSAKRQSDGEQDAPRSSGTRGPMTWSPRRKTRSFLARHRTLVILIIAASAALLGLVLIVLAAGGIYAVLSSTNALSDVLKEVGVSFIVFAFVTAIFELLTRSEIEERIIDGINVFIQGLINKGLVKLFAEFSDQLVFTRQNFNIEVGLEIEGGGQGALAHVKFSYDVSHDEMTPQSYDVILKVDVPTQSTEMKPVLRCDGDPIDIAMERDTETFEDVWLGKIVVPPSQTVKIEKDWKYKGYPQDRMPLFMSDLTKDVRVQVHHPNHNIYLSSLSPVSKPLETESGSASGEVCVWKALGPFLPGHAFQLKWEPKTPR